MVEEEKMLGIIKMVRAFNPYPNDIFLEKTEIEWKRMHKALAKEGIVPDGYFGFFGRMVWDNCCDKIEKMIKEEEEE